MPLLLLRRDRVLEPLQREQSGTTLLIWDQLDDWQPHPACNRNRRLAMLVTHHHHEKICILAWYWQILELELVISLSHGWIERRKCAEQTEAQEGDGGLRSIRHRGTQPVLGQDATMRHHRCKLVLDEFSQRYEREWPYAWMHRPQSRCIRTHDQIEPVVKAPPVYAIAVWTRVLEYRASIVASMEAVQ